MLFAGPILFVLLQIGAEPAQWQAALALARPAKTAVAAFYVENIRFPERDGEVQLETVPPGRPGDPRIRVVAGGSIELSFDASSGFGSGRAFLVPSLVSSRLSWECVTPDLASLPRIAPDCRLAPGYSPPSRPLSPRPTGPPEARVLIHNEDGRSYELDIDRLVRDEFVSGESYSLRPQDVFRLAAEESRERLVAAIMGRMAGRVGDTRSLARLTRIFMDGGQGLIPILDARLPQAPPDSAAAGLLAVCELVRQQTQQHAEEDLFLSCIRKRAARLPLVVEHAVAVSQRALEQLPRESEPCFQAMRVLRAAGAAARPALAAITALLDGDARPASPAVVARRQECGREGVRATLVEILLSEPRDPSLVPLAARAVDEFVAATLAPRSAERPQDALTVTEHLTSLLDSIAWTEALRQRLESAVVARLERCDPLEPERIVDLGRLGVGVLTLVLDRWQTAGCPAEQRRLELEKVSRSPAASEGRVGEMLVDLLRKYPKTGRLHYERTGSVWTRDHLIEAALTIIEPPEGESAAERRSREQKEGRTKTDLKAMLDEVGYVPVAFDEKGTPKFPGNSGLAWTPLPERAIAGSSPGAPGPEVISRARAALARVAAGAPGCQIPLDDEEALRRALAGKALFTFPCGTGAPALVVIGSPSGFKAMNFPERLNGLRAIWAKDHSDQAAEQILAVSDVDGDGNLEILTRRRQCDKCDGWPEADWYAYDLSEESGDWFTYLTRPEGSKRTRSFVRGDRWGQP